MRGKGFECHIVERWNPFAKVRQDMFGFIDIVAVCPHRGIIGIQTTSFANTNARIEKIKAEPRSQKWLNAGGHIIVHGWRKALRKDQVNIFKGWHYREEVL
jgi:hypothetical protein